MSPDDYLLGRWIAAMVVLAMLAGCGSTKEGQSSKDTSRRKRDEASISPKASLAPDGENIQTIQLYRKGDQTTLPLLRLRRQDQATLEFDVMGRDGRQLSVYFYHASRNWERDLSPVEYMNSYQRDDLLDYEASRATQKPYVHYEYTFPNDDIGFEISGNYVVRVTEQGNEEEVLFERAFFITEAMSSAGFRLRRRRLGGGSLPGYQPILRFQPPAALEGGSVFAYNTCFVPNGRFSEARCTSRPQSLGRDALRFDLDPRRAFQVEAASYGLDLSQISVGGAVLEVNQRATPPKVLLEADDVRFPGASGAVALTGQTVLEDGQGDADLSGEYVRARFRFVPPARRPLRRDVYLAGSFNGWRPTKKHQLTWNAGTRRYEGEVLLKQGHYAYRYVSQDPKLRRIQRQALPQTRNQFTALVYYHDATLRTDRLLSIHQTLVR